MAFYSKLLKCSRVVLVDLFKRIMHNAMKKMFLLSLAVGSVLKVNAQRQVVEQTDTSSMKLIHTRTKGHHLIDYLHATTSKHFQDPIAPRFLLYDQQRKIAFGIGGYVRVATSYDFKGSPVNTSNFIPANIPVPMDPLTKNALRMDASKSTLFFKLVGDNDKVGKFQAYISGSFTGANNSFTLDDAYVSLLGFTVGRTWSTFNDIAAVPPTVDFQGPNGAAEMRTTQIRFSNSITEGLSFGIAAELPKTTATYLPTENREMAQRIPDIPAYLQYNWGKSAGSHARIAGVLRNMNYRNLVLDKTETATGYGVQFSTTTKLASFMQFYGQATYGKGIAQYINDLSGRGLSLVNDEEKSGKMIAQEALGWFTQVQFNLSPAVFTTLGYSQAKIFPQVQDDESDKYRYGQYVVGNVFYNIGTDFQLGMEYLWGNRVNMNHEKAAANRIQALVKFNF